MSNQNDLSVFQTLRELVLRPQDFDQIVIGVSGSVITKYPIVLDENGQEMSISRLMSESFVCAREIMSAVLHFCDEGTKQASAWFDAFGFKSVSLNKLKDKNFFDVIPKEIWIQENIISEYESKVQLNNIFETKYPKSENFALWKKISDIWHEKLYFNLKDQSVLLEFSLAYYLGYCANRRNGSKELFAFSEFCKRLSRV